jgi:hypothetical protein
VLPSLLRWNPSAAENWTQGPLLRVLETIRDCIVLHPCPTVAAYWLHELVALCDFVPAIPVLTRLLGPLCRHVGAHPQCGMAASQAVISVCANDNSADGGKLQALLVTYLSSIADASHCLLLLEVVARSVSNPIVAIPLVEAVLLAFLTAVPFHPVLPSSMEAAAQKWTPPSLPASHNNHLPLHDLAACQKTASALTMALVLEHQRLVSPSSSDPATASLWARDFAGPAIVIVSGFGPDSKRPFDCAALWLWCLSACVLPLRVALHKDAVTPLYDWIDVLDAIFEKRATLPPLMRDRMELAASAIAMYAAMLVSASDAKLDANHSGIGYRLTRLQKRSQTVRGVESFTKYLGTLNATTRPPLHQYGVMLIQALFPMAPYMMGVIRQLRNEDKN